MNQLDMAKTLMPTTRVNPGQTTTAYGVATSDSAGGLVMIDMGGDSISPDDDQSIECETTFKVYTDDEVIVSLIGADGTGKTPIVIGVVGRGDEEEEKANALRTRAEELQDEILSTAEETLQRAVGESQQIMQAVYLSKSEAYGTYAEQITTQINNTARQIFESFEYQQLVQSVGDIETYINVINGEIKRGFVEVNGIKTFGIVVSSRNVFEAAGTVDHPPGEENTAYYKIESDECFGLYTATGWQFWKGTQRLAWLDTGDGQLYIDKINIQHSLVMGPSSNEWRLVSNGSSWGIKYLGA